MLALKFLPYGGLFITGGIAAKNPHWVDNETFMHAYGDKGRMSPLVKSVPVYLVLTEDTGTRATDPSLSAEGGGGGDRELDGRSGTIGAAGFARRAAEDVLLAAPPGERGALYKAVQMLEEAEEKQEAADRMSGGGAVTARA